MKAEELTAAAENIGHFLNIVRGAVVLEKALADTATLIIAADDAQDRLDNLGFKVIDAQADHDNIRAEALAMKAEAEAHAEEVLEASEALKAEAANRAAAIAHSQDIFQGIVARRNAEFLTREGALVSREAGVIYREALQIERADALAVREQALEAKLEALRVAVS